MDVGGFLWWAGKFLLFISSSFGIIATYISIKPIIWQHQKLFLLLCQVLSVSLFWTGAVLCNVVHVIVSGMVFLVLFHGGQEATSMPPKPLMNSLRYAFTTSFGSICYGSLFTAAIRTLRWEVGNPMLFDLIWVLILIHWRVMTSCPHDSLHESQLL